LIPLARLRWLSLMFEDIFRVFDKYIPAQERTKEIGWLMGRTSALELRMR
jgi:hypothetical protein